MKNRFGQSESYGLDKSKNKMANHVAIVLIVYASRMTAFSG